MIIRPATSEDAADVQAIYAHHVLHGTGTFEESPPDLDEIRRRMGEVEGRGLPWTVAEDEGRVLGYAYASPFRLRAGYRFTAEDSVYVAPDAAGRGVGKALLFEVVRVCSDLGLRQLLAVIGDSENEASIGVHRACGFEHVGTCPGLGYKQGRFLDVVFMQRPLNGGSDRPPDRAGLAL